MISWKCRKQNSISKSSTEAEYRCLLHASELSGFDIYLKNLMFLSQNLLHMLIIKVLSDSRQIQNLTNKQNKYRSWYHFIREHLKIKLLQSLTFNLSCKSPICLLKSCPMIVIILRCANWCPSMICNNSGGMKRVPIPVLMQSMIYLLDWIKDRESQK